MSGNAHAGRMAQLLRRADTHALPWTLAGDAPALSVDPDGRMVA